MEEAYLGEICLISFKKLPKGWALCDGQALPISENQALFALLGNQFGGDGTSFNLPDLRSRVPVGAGSGYGQGSMGGAESVVLSPEQMPTHTHSLIGTLQTSQDLEDQSPVGNFPAKGNAPQYSSGPANVTMLPRPLTGDTGPAGGGQAHENRQPVLALNYVIAVSGTNPRA